MKIEALELRKGNLIEFRDALWRVLKLQHTKPGKGGAFIQTELKNIEDGTKLNHRFRSEDKVEKAVVEPRPMQYLYPEGDHFVFMDLETFEQVQLDSSVLESATDLLLPNTEVQVLFYNGQPIGVDLPQTVELRVVDTEPVVKGQTATASYKPAQVETGFTVMVPPFVNAGDVIRVSTTDGTYEDRVQ